MKRMILLLAACALCAGLSIRCFSCKGTGWKGQLQCIVCNGTGRL